MTGLLTFVLAALAAPLIAGFSLFAVVGGRRGRRHSVETLATAWLLGYGWIGSILIAVAAAGVGLSFAAAWPAALAPVVALLFVRHPFRRAPAAPAERAAPRATGWPLALIAGIWLLAAAYFLFAIPDCCLTPLKAHDAIGIWGLKSMALYHDGGISPAFFTLDRDAPLHPDYPLLQPMNGAWLLVNYGAGEERLLKAPSLLSWICLLVLLYHFARPRTGPVIAVMLAAAFGLVEFVYMHALVATADLVFAVLVFRALLGLIRHAEEGDAAEFRMAMVFLALAAAAKNEGWAAVAAGVVLVAAGRRSPGRGRRLGAAGALVGTALAVNLPWLLFRWRHGLYTDLFHGEFFLGESPDIGPPPGPGRVFYLIARAADAAFREPLQNEWNAFWIVAALVAVPTMIRLRTGPPAARLLLGFLAMVGAAYLAALCISPHDIAWHTATAIPRLLLHLAVPAAALVAVTVGGFLNGTRESTIAASRNHSPGPDSRPT